MEKNIYYNFDKLCSYGALLSFILGERGVGKTYGASKIVVQDFIKNHNQFVYLRRYKSELDTAVPKFFDALIKNKEFGDHVLTYKKQKNMSVFMVDGEPAGYAIALSTSNILKSTSFPDVRTIIFDEFAINQGTYHYLSNEITQFLELIETIGRLRDNLRVWLLGNSVSINNPYFTYWNLQVPYDSDFKLFKDGLILVNYVKNENYREAKRNSRFGRLINGTKYGDYAIDNKFLNDNDTFIEKRPPEAKFYFNLKISGDILGVWLDYDGAMYISTANDPSSKLTFSFSDKDHDESTILQSRVSGFVKNIINHYREGLLRFESQHIKFLISQSLLKYVN